MLNLLKQCVSISPRPENSPYFFSSSFACCHFPESERHTVVENALCDVTLGTDTSLMFSC